MRLLLIRHAIAEEREDFAQTGQPDDKRPLTKRGKRRMRQAAIGLRSLVPELSTLASSALVRALETAGIVSAAYQDLEVQILDALAPGGTLTELAAWLRARRADSTTALVGHEPDLGQLATWLTTGEPDSRMTFKKGGACLLEFAGVVDAGKATVVWSHAPRELRRRGAKLEKKDRMEQGLVRKGKKKGKNRKLKAKRAVKAARAAAASLAEAGVDS